MLGEEGREGRLMGIDMTWRRLWSLPGLECASLVGMLRLACRSPWSFLDAGLPLAHDVKGVCQSLSPSP